MPGSTLKVCVVAGWWWVVFAGNCPAYSVAFTPVGVPDYEDLTVYSFSQGFLGVVHAYAHTLLAVVN